MISIRRETDSLGYIAFDILDGDHPVCELVNPPGGYDEKKLEATAQVIATALRHQKDREMFGWMLRIGLGWSG